MHPAQTSGAVYLITIAIATWACGSGGNSTNNPTAPPAPASPVTAVAVTGTAPDVERTMQFTATATHADGTVENASSRATWSSSSTTVVTVSGTGLVTGVSIGEADVVAKVGGVTGSSRVVVVGPNLTDFQRDTIEGLFLGTGALVPVAGFKCPTRSTWVGYPKGSTIDIIVSTVVSIDKRNAIQAAAAQIADATGGELHTTFQTTDDPDPRPNRHQVTSTTMADPSTQGCGPNSGCTMVTLAPSEGPGILFGARAVQLPNVIPNNYAHDVIGHGVLNFCHLDGPAIGGPSHSLMGDGGLAGQTIPIGLTELDLTATRAVFMSGLNPGSPRSAFVRAGLIRP